KIIANHDYNLLYNSISPELIQAIKEQLNEKLIAERLGWQVEALVINKKDASFNLPEFVQIPNAVVEFPVKTENNQNVNIRVLNTIVLNLQDPEKAKTHYATVKQLEHETNERISRVVVSNLVNTTYADLIIDRSNYERNIRRELAEWANQLGYAIQNFITIPEVEKEKLGGRFDFSTDEDTEFVTQIGDRVKVQIIVQNARIGDPYQIKQYLTPDTDLRVEVEKAIIRTVTNFLHDKSADDFYTRFELVLQHGLEAEVKKAIIDEFAIDNEVQILAKRINTPLIERFLQLQKGVHYFRFETHAGLSYLSTFSINGIDPNGWVIFRDKNFSDRNAEIGAIKQHLRLFIEGHLNDILPLDFRNFKDPKFRKLLDRLLQEAEMAVRSTFGLVIAITSKKREASDTERKHKRLKESDYKIFDGQLNTREKLASQVGLERINTYKSLQQELKEAKEAFEDDRVKRLERKIAKVEKELDQYNDFSETTQQIDEGLVSPDHWLMEQEEE
ncbi:MAG: hypothetical protein AAFO02_20295, partial [Bacteroidota bacterium]